MLDLGEAADVRMASVIVACWPGPAVDLPTLPLRWGHTNIGALSADQVLVPLPV